MRSRAGHQESYAGRQRSRAGPSARASALAQASNTGAWRPPLDASDHRAAVFEAHGEELRHAEGRRERRLEALHLVRGGVEGVGDIPTGQPQPLLWRHRGCARPDAWRYLSFTQSPVVLLRTGENELEVRALHRDVIDTFAVLGWRDPERPLRVGEVVRVRDRPATVMERRGLTPTRVRYQFARSHNDPRVVLLIGTTRGLEQVRPPPVGRGRRVPVGTPTM